jgi:ATP-dependent RNA helicase DeaD
MKPSVRRPSAFSSLACELKDHFSATPYGWPLETTPRKMPTHARATSFAHFDIQAELHRALQAQGLEKPTPIQANAIPLLLDGRDVIGQARTGSGKTLAFVLPVVERANPALRAIQAVVLVPTRELAIQVGSVLAPLSGTRRLRHTLLYGGRSLGPEQRALRSAQIVVGTPGRTLDHLRQGDLSLDRLFMFVLDEADEMLDRGFAPDVERILAYAPKARQTALFSATLPAWVAGIAARHVRNPVTIEVDANTPAPPEIEHVVYDVESGAKLDALRTLLNRRGDEAVIVFGRTKHGVKKLAQRLEALGYPAAALQGNLSQNARERVMTNFRSGAVPILLATNVAARGLDVPEVGQVINFELPESAEWFTHRVGRTGRMGRAGRAITLLTPDDAAKWRQFERKLGRRPERRQWATSGDAPVGVAPARPVARRAAVVEAPAVKSPSNGSVRSQQPASGSVRLPRWIGWRSQQRRRRGGAPGRAATA